MLGARCLTSFVSYRLYLKARLISEAKGVAGELACTNARMLCASYCDAGGAPIEACGRLPASPYANGGGAASMGSHIQSYSAPAPYCPPALTPVCCTLVHFGGEGRGREGARMPTHVHVLSRVCRWAGTRPLYFRCSLVPHAPVPSSRPVCPWPGTRITPRPAWVDAGAARCHSLQRQRKYIPAVT
ncbi:hypothetical protein NDU88_007010 [Pleurodeles waltl]|uniref:Uncharacterized protein n=1 Tax=Pleurodeles waltl TaxID=8319 RepID=A0AAV7PNK7_PLEWA|nr:hypothetical protein NDU88_007010 [Pleurodeles waltl]